MIVRSEYLADSTGRAIESAEVVVNGGLIASAGKRVSAGTPDHETIDLGRSVILPGFVNAHTHLELTNARSLVEPQPRFTDWIREVVRATGGWSEDEFDASLREGIRLSVEAGVTSLGDIGRGVHDGSAYGESGMRARLFHEAIGFDPADAGGIARSLVKRVERGYPNERLLPGISPHTPYTVSERLLELCADVAHREGAPLCIHLAETRAELEFLLDGTGEILELRKEFGLWPGWTPPRASPVRYLHSLGYFEKPATLVHCNYVGHEDFDIIALSDSSVVFCPRSHDYFGHRDHPFLGMLGHGVNVALGTDSLISSPSLGILDEMKFLRRNYPEIEPALLLRMATTNGAKALGLPVGLGSLAPGSPADLVGVSLPGDAAGDIADPLEAILSKDSEIIFSMVAGEVLHRARRFHEDI
jgi:cytosine/adenosine deaminase-related metal-dependent hydrolase